jgi:hypothetical protein
MDVWAIPTVGPDVSENKKSQQPSGIHPKCIWCKLYTYLLTPWSRGLLEKLTNVNSIAYEIYRLREPDFLTSRK